MKRRSVSVGPTHRIQCQSCPEVFTERGSLKDTEERARIRGWVVWRGTTMGGEATAVQLCPRCRDNKSRGSRAERLAPPEGSQPLF